MEEAASTRFAGRLSAFMYLLSSGMLVLAELVLPNPPGADRVGLLAIAGAAFVVGLIIAVLPWARWPLWTSLLLLFPTFLLIGLNNYFAGVDGYRYAPFFFITFAWIGLTQPTVDVGRVRPAGRGCVPDPAGRGRSVDPAHGQLGAVRAPRLRARR